MINANEIEDRLNLGTLNAGRYYVDRTIETDRQLILPNVTLYTDKNIPILRLKGNYHLEYITLDSTLVKEPTPDVALLEIVIGNTMFSIIDKVRLIGDFHHRVGTSFIKKGSLKESGGNTGIKLICNKDSKWFHWSRTNVHVEGLHTGVDFTTIPLTDWIPNSRHRIYIEGYQMKRLLTTNLSRLKLEYDYNNEHTKLENEKDLDLVALYGSKCEIRTGFPDANDWEKTKTKHGQKLYAHKYKYSDYGKDNICLDSKFDYGLVKITEAEKLKSR